MGIEATGRLGRHVAGKIRAELKRQERSASWLGRRLGVSQPYISRRLAAEVDFDMTDLERIAEVLGVPVAQFLPAPVRAA